MAEEDPFMPGRVFVSLLVCPFSSEVKEVLLALLRVLRDLLLENRDWYVDGIGKTERVSVGTW